MASDLKRVKHGISYQCLCTQLHGKYTQMVRTAEVKPILDATKKDLEVSQIKILMFSQTWILAEALQKWLAYPDRVLIGRINYREMSRDIYAKWVTKKKYCTPIYGVVN